MGSDQEFRLSDEASFDENFESFLTHLHEQEPELTAILRANQSTLAKVIVNGASDITARAEFNSAVASALDELVNEAGGD